MTKAWENTGLGYPTSNTEVGSWSFNITKKVRNGGNFENSLAEALSSQLQQGEESQPWMLWGSILALPLVEKSFCYSNTF